MDNTSDIYVVSIAILDLQTAKRPVSASTRPLLMGEDIIGEKRLYKLSDGRKIIVDSRVV